MSPALGPVRLAGDPQAAYLGPGAWGLDSRVSQKTPGQVDAETRRLVEEALDIVVTAGLAEIAANSIAMGLGC